MILLLKKKNTNEEMIKVICTKNGRLSQEFTQFDIFNFKRRK